jgi:hypothetical protein
MGYDQIFISQEALKMTVDIGSHDVGEEIQGFSYQTGFFSSGNEFIKYRNLSFRFAHPSGLRQAGIGIRNNS